MKALFRYTLLKGMRENLIPVLLFTPALMFVSPLLATTFVSLFRGRDVWPLSLPGGLTPAASAHVLTMPSSLIAAVIAGLAAFWIFRSEFSGKTVAFFLLAQVPVRIPFAVMLFGAMAGAASYAIVMTAIALLTQSSMPLAAATMHAAIGGIFAAAAVGTLALGVSSQLSILVPASLLVVPAVITLLEWNSVAASAVTVVTAFVLTAAASSVWRRRCSI